MSIAVLNLGEVCPMGNNYELRITSYELTFWSAKFGIRNWLIRNWLCPISESTALLLRKAIYLIPSIELLLPFIPTPDLKKAVGMTLWSHFGNTWRSNRAIRVVALAVAVVLSVRYHSPCNSNLCRIFQTHYLNYRKHIEWFFNKFPFL